MKLQAKILINSFIAIVIALLIMAYIIVKMIDMQSTSNEFSNNLIQIEQMNSSMVSFQQALDNYGKNPTEGNLVNAISNYNDVLLKVEILENIPYLTSYEESRVAHIKTKVGNMIKDMDIIVSESMTIEAMRLSSKINGIINDIYILKLSMNEQYDQLIKANNNRILYTSITSALILIVLSSILNLFTTRRIVKPISTLNEYSKEIAAGNLALKEVETNTKDEVGQLTKSFNTMKADLQTLIDRIQTHANELLEKNNRINDSIDYAKRIQEAVLPTEDEIAENLKEHFLIWEPRDTVGGDFYWCKNTEKGMYIAVADCTGHGVPGALMTTLSISTLNHIVEEGKDHSPAIILEKLHRRVKESLSQETKSGYTDDGLDIGICYMEGNKMTFAGAKLSLFISREGKLTEIKGDRKSIGYRRTPFDYKYTDEQLEVRDDDVFYMTTDGFIDQNGKDGQYSLGKKFLTDLIEKVNALPLPEQKIIFEKELKQFMGEEAQRDDITILAFRK